MPLGSRRREANISDTALARINCRPGARVANEREILSIITADNNAVDIELLSARVRDDDSLVLARLLGYLIAEVDAARIDLGARRRRLFVLVARVTWLVRKS